MNAISLPSLFALFALSALPALAACSDDDMDDGPNASAGVSGAAGSAGTSGAAGAPGGASGAGGANDGFQVGGAATGASVPASAQLVVLWSVVSDGPDYLYKFGDGASTGAQFVTTLGAAPPPGAINSFGLAMGTVYAFKPGFAVPEGRADLKKDDLAQNAIAVTARHIVLWRDASKPGLPWSGAFPAGYACGRCAPAAGPDGTSGYEPVECGAVELTFFDDIDAVEFCN